MRFLAPRYWPTWLGLALMRVLVWLPWRAQMAAGRGIGRLARRLARQRRHIAATNLALCFPELTPAEREHLLRAHFEALGQGLVETALCWWGHDAPLRRRVCITGLEHLRDALKSGEGVLLLSAHFTGLELGGRLLSLFTPFHVLYRQHRNPLFEAVMRRARERRFERAIPHRDMRALLASLRTGRAVWYAPDQNHGGEHSVFVPFFGVPAATLTTPARIARLGRAKVIPFYPSRTADGYLLTLCPPLEHFPSGNAQADARRLNALLEDVIREMPEQYLWVHRRFKTRPPGEPDPYRP